MCTKQLSYWEEESDCPIVGRRSWMLAHPYSSFAYTRLQQLDRLVREHPHVGFAVSAASLERDHGLDGAGHRNARVARCISISITGWSAGTRFT